MVDLVEGKIPKGTFNVGRDGVVPMDITNVTEYASME
jgi:hypothetical protein